MIDDLDSKNVEELRRIAGELQISGRSEMNKTELTRAINEQQASASNPASAAEVAALRQTVASQQQTIDALHGRVTQLEARQAGTVPNDPIPQRR